MSNISVLIKTVESVLRYNADVKKKAQKVQNLDIWAQEYTPIIGGKPLSELIRTNKKGEKYLIPRHSLN